MKRFISLLLVTVLCAALVSISAGAALPPYLIGDVNWDGSFDSVDITLTQRHLAKISELDAEYQAPMADFDHDGEVGVPDVTWMQRNQARMDIPEGYGGLAEIAFQVSTLSASYDSGSAVVGVPVELTANLDNWYNHEHPFIFEFYVDGKLLQSSTDNYAVVVFDTAGRHSFYVKVINWQGFCSRDANYYYQVVESIPDDGLMFKKADFLEKPGMTYYPTLITQAMGGTAPYTYSLKFYHYNMYTDGSVTGLTDSEINHIKSYEIQIGYGMFDTTIETDESGRRYLYRDFLDCDQTQWCMDMFPYDECYLIEVQAKDANGNLSPVKNLYYENSMLIG